jgi:hypothetical protein
MANIRRERQTLKTKADTLDQMVKEQQVDLNEEQNEEMRIIISQINQNHKHDLEEVIEDLNDKDHNNSARASWLEDSNKQHSKDITNVFTDQANNETGKTNNRWSIITYRMALAVYSRSRAAYEALKCFNILNLPSVRSLQTKTGKFLDGPGINHTYLKEQSEKYTKFKQENEQKGTKVPLGEGVLIFDEVKVIQKVIWN